MAELSVDSESRGSPVADSVAFHSFPRTAKGGLIGALAIALCRQSTRIFFAVTSR